MADKSWEVEIEKINGDIKVINQQLDHIKNNHLWHIQRDVDRLNRLAWTIGILVFTNFVFIIRDVFF